MRADSLFFGQLYFVQGAALAYAVNFQKPFLSSHGVAKETLGLFTAVLLIPFVGKVFLGALSDRWGQRKPLVLAGLFIFAACYLILSGLDPGANFWMFGSLTFVASLGMALFDTCADGWAVDLGDESTGASTQAAMIAGKALGLIVGAAAFGYFGQEYGYGVIFRGLAALAALRFAFTLLTHEAPARVRPAGFRWRDARRPGLGRLATFGVLYSVASFGTDGLVTLHLMETKLANAAVIGQFGASRGFGALLGAYAYLRLNTWLGSARSRFIAIGLLGLGCLIPLADLEVNVSGLAWGACWGLQETAFVTWAMRTARGAWGATVFALMMITSNLGTAIGEALASPMVPRVGYPLVFIGFAALAWASAAALPRRDLET